MKTAFITGANRGLGRGFVEYLSGKGFEVFAGLRRRTDEHRDSSSVHWVEIDVTDDESIDKAVNEVAARVNQLNILINNAGVNKDTATGGRGELVSRLADLDRGRLMTMFNVNAIAPMIVLQKFFPLLTGNQSFVINISSCRASFHDEFKNSSGNYGYRASKIALNMLTFCSLYDLPNNIKTLTVHPGDVKTDMNKGGTTEPRFAAERIMSIIDTWDERFNGQFLRYDGTLYPL